MIQNLPIEIQSLIIDHLECEDTYRLLHTSRELNDEFGKDEFKKRYHYHYRILQKLVNKDFLGFMNKIRVVSTKSDLDKIFIYSLNHIGTVWLNKEQGFYCMNYILECMIMGCRITEISILQNHTAKHFFENFYDNILENIIEGDKIGTQEKIDNSRMLRSLHSNFKPYKKN
jgi:hypothetical protein